MKIIQVDRENIRVLRTISVQTFEQTFGADNTKDDMDKYFQEQLSIEIFEDEIEKNEVQYYLLEDNETIVGYVKLKLRDSVCKLIRIYVLNQYQGKGYGQTLLDFVLDIATSNNTKHIELGVWEHNLKAIKFYKKNKFKIIDNIQFVLGEDVQNDYVMQLKIGA